MEDHPQVVRFKVHLLTNIIGRNAFELPHGKRKARFFRQFGHTAVKNAPEFFLLIGVFRVKFPVRRMLFGDAEGLVFKLMKRGLIEG